MESRRSQRKAGKKLQAAISRPLRAMFEALEGRAYLSAVSPNATDSSLAYDSTGTLHVAYYDSTAKELFYATQAGNGGWSTPVAIAPMGSDVGNQIALGIGPRGEIDVVYHDASLNDLQFAQLDGSSWNVATIDSNGDTGLNPQLSFASNDMAVVTYYNDTSNQLEVATSRNKGWRIFDIGPSADSFTSIAVNPTTQAPSVAYENTAGQIYIADIVRKGISAPTALGKSVGGTGELSAAFTAAGQAAVAYRNPGGRLIKVVQATPAQQFTITNVAQVAKTIDPQPTLSFSGQTGHPQVVYDDSTQNALTIAKYHPSGTQWVTKPLQYGVSTDSQGVAYSPSGLIAYAAFGGDSTSSLAIDNTSSTATAPTNVAVTDTSANETDITWTDSAGDETGFAIARSTDGTNFTPIATVAAGVLSYADTSVTPDTEYYYHVSAIGQDGSQSLGLVSPLVPSISTVTSEIITPESSSISGFVYKDVTDLGEPGVLPLAGVAAQLTLTGTDANGNAITPLITSSDPGTGSFSFNGLTSGTYTVTLSQPSGYLPGKQNSSGVISGIALTAGQSQNSELFGEVQPASVGGSVYLDSNDDGVRQQSESGVAGARITLSGTDDLGNPVSSGEYTASDGTFAFSNLRPGTYTVSETPPTGLLIGKQNATGTSGTLSLAPGSNSTGVSFGELSPASIAGFAYNDVNDDGVKQSGESGIAGVTVKLTGTNDLGNTANEIVMTASDGSYNFTNLRPGAYVVTETPPSGLLAGKQNPTGTSGSLTINSGTNSTGVSFGELSPASVSGFVYNDANDDGVKQSGESGISGVTVSLAGTNDLSSPVSLTQTTASNGSYSFTNLRPGAYTLTETEPTGYTNGINSQGTPSGTVGTLTFSTIPITSGTTGQNYDFAQLVPPPTNLAAAIVGGNTYQVSWTETSSLATGFIVERSVDSGSWSTIATPGAGATNITDSGVSVGHVYSYRVTAITATGNSLASQPLTAAALNAPSTPINLSAAAVSDTEVNLTWDRVGTGETSITVRRSTGGGPYQVLQVLPAGSNIFTDTSCYPSTSYSYEITADNGAGSSSPSVTSSATTEASLATLPAATNLTATAVSPFEIDLLSTGNVIAYANWFIERSTNGISYSIIAVVQANGSSGTTINYNDTPLAPATTYYYRIRESSGSGYSNYSSPVSATTMSRLANTPLEPADLTATVNSATSTALTWTDTNNGTAAYLIETALFNYSGGNGDDGGYGTWTQIAETPVGADSYSFTTSAETFYYVRIRAMNSMGDSGYTEPVTVRSASPGTGSAKIYTIGPGEEYASLGALNWSQLGPGDTVEIFPNRDGSGNIIPYYEKPLISVRGTASAPINIIGMPDPTTGELPIIDGTNAVTNSQWDLSSGHIILEDYSLVLIGTRPSQTSTGWSPGYLNIENLQLQNAYEGAAADEGSGPALTYSAGDGTTRSYGGSASGIYIEDGDHILIKGNIITGNNEGIFGAGQGDQRNLEEITIDANQIYGNGTVDGEGQHGTYLEGINTLYEYNYYGPLRIGSLGAGLKDRGAGTIIQYNYISGGAHLIDLVEAENYIYNTLAMPSYNYTYVYGNILYNDYLVTGDRTLIDYGGDQGITSAYRKGILYFYNNTVVNQASEPPVFNFTVFDLASSGESLDARNNIIDNIPQSPGQPTPEMDLLAATYGSGGYGNAYFGTNWISQGWQDSNSGYGPFLGHIAGTSNFIGNSQNNAGFVSLSSLDFQLAIGSQCIDQESELPAEVPPVESEYIVPGSGDPLPYLLSVLDLGALQ